MEKLNIKKEEKIFDAYFKVIEAEIEVGKGRNKKSISRLKLERPNAVAVLIFNQDTEEFVLVRQNRYPIVSENGNAPIYEIPAGLIDEGEEPLEAVKREVLEEVGYKISDENIDLIQEYFPSVGITSEKTYLYLATVSSEDRVQEGGGLEIEGEFLEVVHLPQKTVYDMWQNGEIIDGKTIISLLFIQIATLSEDLRILEETK